MTEETKITLVEFLEFLVKQGYCDTDVYSEANPGMTVIDEFMIKKRKDEK